jgi:hypothetical protein
VLRIDVEAERLALTIPNNRRCDDAHRARLWQDAAEPTGEPIMHELLLAEEWTATVEDLTKARDKHKVPQAEKDELLGALGPMKPDIVGK